MATKYLYPSSTDQTVGTIVGQPGASGNIHLFIDDPVGAYDNLTSYVVLVGAATHYYTVSFDTMPTVAGISDVLHETRGLKENAGANNLTTNLVDQVAESGRSYGLANSHTTTSFTTLSNNSATDPFTTGIWTVANLNSYYLHARRAGDALYYARITAQNLQVTYSPAGGVRGILWSWIPPLIGVSHLFGQCLNADLRVTEFIREFLVGKTNPTPSLDPLYSHEWSFIWDRLMIRPRWSR